MRRCSPGAFATATIFAIAVFAPITRAQDALDTAAIDRLFARYASDATPGAVISIHKGGHALFERAYGMADLENAVPNTITTVFEAGSVSKQVTAAAVLLLVARGKLALDDDVRRWFPELPDYGEKITVDHLLHHTSGLRDWGVIGTIEGWPRSSRTVTQAHVLAIIARQRALNHPVGAQFSYTNSGYNLLAMLVERAGGVPLPELTRSELFEPLGMTHTEWRDDFARVVKHRAQAYVPRGTGWQLAMPFENAYGHGGLLTTASDFQKWNAALTAHRVGDPDVSEAMAKRGVLRDGSAIDYACGLIVHEEGGVPEISHDGRTAGYTAFLARYPEQDVSVVLLSNAGDLNPGGIGRRAIAGLVPFAAAESAPTTQPSQSQSPPPEFDRTTIPDFVGTWHSDEAAATYTVRDTLQIVRWPGDLSTMEPAGPDVFVATGMLLRFERDADHRVQRLFVSLQRAMNVEFARVDAR